MDILRKYFPIRPGASSLLDIARPSFYIVFSIVEKQGLILACPCDDASSLTEHRTWITRNLTDFAVIETYDFESSERLACPVSVFGADDDGGTRRDDLLAWRELTGGSFRLRTFPGTRFFIRSQHRKGARAVLEDLLAPASDNQSATPC